MAEKKINTTELVIGLALIGAGVLLLFKNKLKSKTGSNPLVGLIDKIPQGVGHMVGEVAKLWITGRSAPGLPGP